jgi:3-hydroxyisobutyrate dehydrogenase-like beta-hydroxyacid dehydrogenase
MGDLVKAGPQPAAEQAGAAPSAVRPAVGFIGLGDQGLPMAVAIAEGGFELHAWARRPVSLDGLRGVEHVRHDDLESLAATCDVVCLCVSTDRDVMRIVTDDLLGALRPGSVVVNHGTGTPGTAVRMTQACTP